MKPTVRDIKVAFNACDVKLSPFAAYYNDKRIKPGSGRIKVQGGGMEIDTNEWLKVQARAQALLMRMHPAYDIKVSLRTPRSGGFNSLAGSSKYVAIHYSPTAAARVES